ncbi:thiol reductant ABC exporter subunit CydC [Schaalia sp. 19OD2882]|nr:thiol reductant ABC exporter subunit CydC [Schaalia sp. 19OD2882]
MFLTRDERKALARVLHLLAVDKANLALSVLIGCLGMGSAIALGATSAWLIAKASQHPPVLELSVAATAVRTFGVARAIMRYLQRVASHKVALLGMDNLRQGIYAHLSRGRAEHLVSLTRGDILARAGADVDDVGDLVVKAVLPAMTTSILALASVLGIALVSPEAALVLALCLLTSGLVAPLLSMRATRMAQTVSARARADLSEHSLTILEGASHLQVAGRLSEARAALSDAEDRVLDGAARSARVMGLAQGVDRFASGAAVVGALVVAGPDVASGTLAALALAVVVLTPLAAFEGTSEMGMAAAQLVRSAKAAVRIDELLGPEEHRADDAEGAPVADTGTTLADKPGPALVDKADPDADLTADEDAGETAIAGLGAPALHAVDLAIGWPDGPLLVEGIDVDLAPGRRVAVVGPSGIGKTTLLMTLAGIIPPKSGRLSGAGPQVSVTAEDAHVFATTVLENIRVARADVTEEEALQLLARVGLGHWVEHLPQGVHTLLGSGSTTVSGGERRRLLMARALASPCPIVLLDEAGEHLDPATADALVATLLAPDPDLAVLLVTHRLSALEEADDIIVLDRPDPARPACVVARGRHEDLLAAHPTYRNALDKEKP